MTDIFLPIVSALSAYRFLAHDERRLYEGLSRALTDAGFAFERERVLVYPDRRIGRLDYFLPDTRLAIEIKVRGRHDAVLRQITRYAEHTEVAAVLLVTTMAKLAHAPESLAGKPVQCLRITGAFG